MADIEERRVTIPKERMQELESYVRSLGMNIRSLAIAIAETNGDVVFTYSVDLQRFGGSDILGNLLGRYAKSGV